MKYLLRVLALTILAMTVAAGGAHAQLLDSYQVTYGYQCAQDECAFLYNFQMNEEEGGNSVFQFLGSGMPLSYAPDPAPPDVLFSDLNTLTEYLPLCAPGVNELACDESEAGVVQQPDGSYSFSTMPFNSIVTADYDALLADPPPLDPPTVTPEPSSFLLMLGGIAFLLVSNNKRMAHERRS
jgi:hypothetical protein